MLSIITADKNYLFGRNEFIRLRRHGETDRRVVCHLIWQQNKDDGECGINIIPGDEFKCLG